MAYSTTTSATDGSGAAKISTATVYQDVVVAYSTTSSATDRSGATTITTVHQDVVVNHILTRLDCLTLTSLSCTSSYFHSLSSQEILWRNICMSKWPSMDDPRVIQLISAFPNGYRGCFSDSFPILTAYDKDQPAKLTSLPSKLISAVDLSYRERPVSSRVLETETGSEWFQHSPFRVDLLDPKEVLPIPIKIDDWDDDMWQQDLKQNLTLSWIIIDPTRKRAGNFPSLEPVSVQRHWLTGEVRVEYATVLGCNRFGFVECKVVVTCGMSEQLQGELHVREACLQVEDMDGKYLNGKDSLVTLMRAMEFGKRSRKEEERRKRHGEYLEMKRLKRERKVLKEKVMDVACVTGVSILLTTSILLLVS